MKNYFHDLLAYNLWANQRVLGTISQKNVEDEEIMKLMSHLVSAEIIWLHRIEGLPTSPFPPWEVYKLRELESMVDESNVRWTKFLNNYKIDTLEEIVHYQNSHRKNFENRLKDIFTHAINHSTHHRSQICLLLRKLDIDPPQIDFIVFKRQSI